MVRFFSRILINDFFYLYILRTKNTLNHKFCLKQDNDVHINPLLLASFVPFLKLIAISNVICRDFFFFFYKIGYLRMCVCVILIVMIKIIYTKNCNYIIL